MSTGKRILQAKIRASVRGWEPINARVKHLDHELTSLAEAIKD
jgi:hypothetical protein